MNKELEVLREVRSLMETNWQRGRNYQVLINRDGQKVERFCLVGGINKVTGVRMLASSGTDEKYLFPWGKKAVRTKVLDMIGGRIDDHIEIFNDQYGQKEVLKVLNSLIMELEGPKSMEIGTPDKEYTIEPAEPVPGIEESPAPTPEPRREPAKPNREKVPA